ncbi:MAG: dTDP-4-dehydrorhamnose 3,5-epimerase [Caldisphaera sp.]
MPFSFKRMEIPDVVLSTPKMFNDVRGFFSEIYKRTDFLAEYVPYDFVQVNLSSSKRGVIRGLHYQMKPMEQGKLVTVIKGKIYDVALDIRNGSPYYGKHVAVELNDQNRSLFWVPPGFAHGFQALEDSLVVYFVTKEYSPPHERCINWRCEEVAVNWPLKDAIVIEKDSKCPKLKDAENNFLY